MRLIIRSLCVTVFMMLCQAYGYSQPSGPDVSVAELKRQLQGSENDSLKIWTCISLANAYLEENKLDSCYLYAQKAKHLATINKSEIAEGWANLMIGTYFYYQGYYDRGIEIQSEVATKAEKWHDPLLRANALKMIAWMYTEMGKEKEALALFKESLPIFKKFSYRDIQMNIGIAFYGIATSYYYMSNYDSAALYYDSAIAARPAMDSRELALALADRAALLREHKNAFNLALKDALTAVKLLTHAALQQDALAYVEAELALTYARMGQMGAAESWANQAYDRYESIPLVKRYVSVYRSMAETFVICKNYKRAFEVERTTSILEDSIYKWRKLQVVEGFKLKYEAEKKNQEIASLTLARLKQDVQLERTQYIIIGVVIFIFFASAFFYFFYRKREKYYLRIRALEAAQQVRKEKDRIALDLHDSLGSRLSTISLSLQHLQQETSNPTISKIQEMTDSTMNELRDSIWAMNKDFIELEELVQRINSLFWQYRRMDLPIEFELLSGKELNQKLPSFLAGNVFRIAQEAINNAVKHSGANRIEVSLQLTQNVLDMTISDNGNGFNVNQEAQHNHFGLFNMRKRADQIKGKLQLTSRERAGAKVHLTVPL